MDVADKIAQLCAAERHPDLPGPELLPTRVMRATAAVLPVAAAGISAFGRFRHRVPLGASDDTAALAERLQFTVGDGPCLTAHASGRTVLATADLMARCWPTFYHELTAHTPYRAIVSIPIVDQALGGELAMDLYYDCPDLAFKASQHISIAAVTAAIVTQLDAGSGLQDPLAPGPVWLNSEPALARSMVWTAVGLIDVALEINSRDALAVLRGYAYSHDATIDDIARSLVTQELAVDALAS